MDLRSLFTTTRRWAWLIVTGAVLAGGTAYVITTIRMPPANYQAEAVMLVGPALDTIHADSGQMDAARRLSLVYVEVARSRPVLQRVAEKLELATDASVLRQRLVVETSQEPPIISITAVANDPTLAAAIANAVADELIDVAPTLDGDDQEALQFMERQTKALEQEIETLIPEVESLAGDPARTEAEDQRLAELQSRLAGLRGTYAALVSAMSPTSSNQVSIIEEAQPDPRPLSGGRMQTVLLASVLGVVVTAGIAYSVERLDDKIRRPQHIASVSSHPVLGNIGRMASADRKAPMDLGTAFATDSPTREAFRTLRTNLELAVTALPRSLLITSAHDREGRTTIAAYLAAALAHSGTRVLLVDADLRQPEMRRLFDLPGKTGLGELLVSRDRRVSDLIQETTIPGLRVLTAGKSADAANALHPKQVRAVVDKLSQSAGMVIMDSPAILAASEARVLASAVDATLLVVAAGRTSIGSLREALDILALSRASVIGTVINRTPANPRRHADTSADERVSRPAHSLREDHLGS